MDLLNKFDDLRMQRMPIAQEFVARYANNDELLADLANILALFFAANQMMLQPKPKGFQPGTAGFISDTK